MMADKSEEWNKYLAVRAAWMSFVSGQTQNEIAEQLNISQAKVHRLIAQAQKAGLIQIRIEGRPVECLEMEDLLVQQFGLNNCIIAPFTSDPSGDDQLAINVVGAAAASYIQNLLSTKKIRQIGVGMGRTLAATIKALPSMSMKDLKIVSVSGSLTRKLSANPYDIVQQFQACTGGEGYFLPVPYLAKTKEEKEIFHRQESVRELLNQARKSELFFIGIGSLSDEGHLMSAGLVSDAEMQELRAKGASGDLMSCFLNSSGTVVQSELGEKAVGLHLEEIRGASVLAVAGGDSKSAATLAALRSGVITDLVIDESLAALVLAESQPSHLKMVQ